MPVTTIFAALLFLTAGGLFSTLMDVQADARIPLILGAIATLTLSLFLCIQVMGELSGKNHVHSILMKTELSMQKGFGVTIATNDHKIYYVGPRTHKKKHTHLTGRELTYLKIQKGDHAQQMFNMLLQAPYYQKRIPNNVMSSGYNVINTEGSK